MPRLAFDRSRGGSQSSDAPPRAARSRAASHGGQQKHSGSRRTDSAVAFGPSGDEYNSNFTSPHSNAAAAGSFVVGSPESSFFIASPPSKTVPATPKASRRPSAAEYIAEKYEDFKEHFKDRFLTPQTDINKKYWKNRKREKRRTKLENKQGWTKLENPDVLDKPGHTNKLRKFLRSSGHSEVDHEFDPTSPEDGGRLAKIPEAREPSRSPHLRTRTMDSTGPLSAARMMADETERKRRAGEAKDMAERVASIAQRTNREIPPYDFLELIGKGAYGRVYKCRDRRSGDLVAVKIINVEEQDFATRLDQGVDDATIPDIRKEVGTLQQLKDNKVKNVNVIHDAFDFYDQLWIVADYCTGGSVRTLMRPFYKGLRPTGLPEEYIIPIARELALAIKGIHDLSIVHRDIKCANLYITETGDIQLGDFGIVGVMEDKNSKRKTIVGTPHWMSLEMLEADLKSSKGYGNEVDVWAYGCTLYEMATGAPPHPFADHESLPARIRQAPPKLEDESYSEGLRDLINTCLTVEADARPTMETVLKHPAIANTGKKYPVSTLVDLITKFKLWEHGGGSRTSLWMEPRFELPKASGEKIEQDDEGSSELAGFDDWNFSTSEDFDRRISQLPDLNSNDLSFFQAQVDAGLPLQTQDLSIQERVLLEQKQRSAIRGENALNALFDINNPDGYKTAPQIAPAEGATPESTSDLPLRNFTSNAPTRESMIEIDLDDAAVGGTATSTFALHMNALNEDTIKPMTRTSYGDDDDDTYAYGTTTNDSTDKRATMEWTFPATQQPKRETMDWKFPSVAPAQAKRDTMDWKFSTAEPAEPDEPEFSMDLPSAGFGGELAPAFRPELKHTTTEPVGHFRDFSHDMRPELTSPDRSSIASMIDLNLGLADPVMRFDDPANIVRPSTASSIARSDMTSGNPFDLEEDPIQNEVDRNRFSYHKQFHSDGGTLNRLSHKTMQMHARGNSLSGSESETHIVPPSFAMQTPPTNFNIGDDLDFSDDANQFPNFSTFDSFGSDGPPVSVPRLGDPTFPLQPSLHSNGFLSRSREPSSQPAGPEIGFPPIVAPQPDALSEHADPQLLDDELGRMIDVLDGSMEAVMYAFRHHAKLDDEDEDGFNTDLDAGFSSTREDTEDESASEYLTSRRSRARKPSPRLPQTESFA